MQPGTGTVRVRKCNRFDWWKYRLPTLSPKAVGFFFLQIGVRARADYILAHSPAHSCPVIMASRKGFAKGSDPNRYRRSAAASGDDPADSGSAAGPSEG